MISRRGFLSGLMSLVAAPAIVRAESIMPVRASRIVLADPAVIVQRTLIDKLLGFPVAVWMDGRDYAQVEQGIHRRYCLPSMPPLFRLHPRRMKGDDDFPGLGVSWLPQDFSFLRKGEPGVSALRVRKGVVGAGRRSYSERLAGSGSDAEDAGP